MAKKINMWAWISLASLLIGVILFPLLLYQIPELFVLIILISFGTAIKAIKEIHKDKKYFKGLWLAITCLIFSSFILIVMIILYIAIAYFGGIIGDFDTNFTLASDDEVINYSIELANDYGINDSSELSDFVIRILNNSETNDIFWINETDRQEMNISDIFNVRMKRKTNNLVSNCDTTFANNGLILEDFECRLS